MINHLDICIQSNLTIERALLVINNNQARIALVVDKDNRLLGTLNDGDIRRALLNKSSISDVVDGVYHRKPIVANDKKSKEDLLDLCHKKKISSVPIVDSDNKIVDLYVLEYLLPEKKYDNQIVLMVGGLGTRLKPLTDSTPKPMLHIGGKPILETIVNGFVNSGFTNITMCLGYKSNVIQEYFQDGSKFGANIDFVVENKRLGTAGALALLMKKPDKPFFVMNGDLLTNIDFTKMLYFHNSCNAKATMCVREFDIEVPYGVIGVNDEKITSIDEKPIHSFFINAGIYLLEPELIDLIPDDTFYDMPTLFNDLIDTQLKAISFPLQEYWMDIGRISDYKKANIEYSAYF